MKHIYAGLIVPVSAIIPIGIGFFKRLYLNAGFNIILIYLVFAMVIDIAERLIGQRHINNLPLLHFYTLVEGLLIFCYFRKVFNNPKFQLAINWFIPIFIVITFVDFTFLHSIYQFNSYARSISAVFIVICSVIAFYSNAVSENPRIMSFDWITAGILLYFSSSLVYFELLNVLAANSPRDIWNLIQNIHATFVLAMYALVATGFLYEPS
ncbi:hypothetical protein [Mucilaginibacter jinjuensis]|uniref:YhhN-like protein n=1 Tax=Mucilaginibacter jinjuensis TaxID=1176721 RepID=A0ABY7TDG9_9SPHI|nr:hypothetical protein [Mucilaginibacter jinjuensis]WCT14417.1 hypothetical protein PQO05_10785 [Mucilaginibacter jinjuensis]